MDVTITTGGSTITCDFTLVYKLGRRKLDLRRSAAGCSGVEGSRLVQGVVSRGWWTSGGGGASCRLAGAAGGGATGRLAGAGGGGASGRLAGAGGGGASGRLAGAGGGGASGRLAGSSPGVLLGLRLQLHPEPPGGRHRDQDHGRLRVFWSVLAVWTLCTRLHAAPLLYETQLCTVLRSLRPNCAPASTSSRLHQSTNTEMHQSTSRPAHHSSCLLRPLATSSCCT